MLWLGDRLCLAGCVPHFQVPTARCRAQLRAFLDLLLGFKDLWIKSNPKQIIKQNHRDSACKYHSSTYWVNRVQYPRTKSFNLLTPMMQVCIQMHPWEASCCVIQNPILSFSQSSPNKLPITLRFPTHINSYYYLIVLQGTREYQQHGSN